MHSIWEWCPNLFIGWLRRLPVSSKIQEKIWQQVKAVAKISLPLSNIMIIENLGQIWMFGGVFGKPKLESSGGEPLSSRATSYLLCAQLLSRAWNFAAPWSVTCQAPLPMGFPRQESWNRLPFPTPGSLPNPVIETTSLASSALTGKFFTTSATWEAPEL